MNIDLDIIKPADAAATIATFGPDLDLFRAAKAKWSGKIGLRNALKSRAKDVILLYVDDANMDDAEALAAMFDLTVAEVVGARPVAETSAIETPEEPAEDDAPEYLTENMKIPEAIKAVKACEDGAALDAVIEKDGRPQVVKAAKSRAEALAVDALPTFADIIAPTMTPIEVRPGAEPAPEPAPAKVKAARKTRERKTTPTLGAYVGMYEHADHGEIRDFYNPEVVRTCPKCKSDGTVGAAFGPRTLLFKKEFVRTHQPECRTCRRAASAAHRAAKKAGLPSKRDLARAAKLAAAK